MILNDSTQLDDSYSITRTFDHYDGSEKSVAENVDQSKSGKKLSLSLLHLLHLSSFPACFLREDSLLLNASIDRCSAAVAISAAKELAPLRGYCRSCLAQICPFTKHFSIGLT